jgi:hypothetical protein
MLNKFIKRAVIAGVISLMVIGLGTFLIGELSGYEAKVLIKNSISGINTLCNTIILASATILALLLTVLSLSASSDSKLKPDHFRRILLIAKLDTIVIIASLLSFLILNLPITESETVPQNWFKIVYYVSMATTSLLSASLIVVILMLYNTVVDIIKVVGLGMTNHPLAEGEEKEDDKSE